MSLVSYGFKCVNEDCDKFGIEYEDLLERDGEHKSRCPVCHRKAQRVFSLAGFTMDFKPGFDVGLGEYVSSANERDNICAERGYRRIKD